MLQDIQLEGESEVLHTSEYVYLATGASSLCHTSNFQWKRNVDVYLVVSVKNLGAWVQHLIHNMEHVRPRPVFLATPTDHVPYRSTK